ncbi:MAG TPA: PD-(D/E)XK nuclease family protein [Candidatus Acidoferrales bacterium]|nr:PD-(D/E)XK nuclease family protein [Candidatus Acidoferrales bacterium]
MRFLLGPAGSGKTFRCLAEIRAALAQAPASLRPLILLAPKQATFQLERQLLAEDSLAGFTRLRVLSFDRLAAFIFETLNVAPPRLLSAEGRLMVLRALLRRHHGELKRLGASARQPGFAQELGGQLAELQQQQIGPARLRAIAAAGNLRPELRDKLEDLALLLEKYSDWLKTHDLQDADCLLDSATDRLRAESNARPAPFAIEGLWLDGFAEMTPQEHALLAAVVPFCQQAALAFCLETEPTPASSWLSIWSAIGKTFQQCRQRLAALPGAQLQTEILQRVPGKNRFAENSALGALETGWSLPVAADVPAADLNSEISVTACATPEAEAVLAAREVLQFVRRDSRHRFRDCAVLVRSLEHYHQPLAQTLRRYGIPFFLDRREKVAHHPLAELTRSALRTIAHEWRHDDWFAALKTGFTPLPETEIDRLENLALEFGWLGEKWREPLPDDGGERLRQIIIGPFETLHQRLQRQKMEPTGAQLADAIAGLWSDLEVEPALAKWALPEGGAVALQSASLHRTVFEQMSSWLENVALAFPRERLPLRDWLQVLEAGLAALTVGVIPPALDEVLVGAIDRARNPNLKFALLLGLNESVFPAPPAAPAILTHSDREALDQRNASLGLNVLAQISRERYLGYIACTRASRKLAVTFALRDTDGRTLNPSPFIAHLKQTLPRLEVGEFSSAIDWRQAEHVRELGAFEIRNPNPRKPVRAPVHGLRPLLEIPAVKVFAQKLAQLREPLERENLSPALADKIYGPVLKSSVSRLEEFAQCPFRFFVHVGLRAEERKTFELDARERGSFQHEILKEFHDGLVAENKRWRDLAPAEARDRISRIAAALAPVYRAGLLRADHQSRFAARVLTVALQDFVATLVGWMRGQYGFDPAKAETGFGLDDSSLPAWEIDLGKGRQLALRGRVDRIDLCHAGDHSLAVVVDYKSSARRLDKVLIEHGVQLQLLAYLAAVRRWPAEFLGAKKIVPAGVFYVNLRGQFEGGASRDEVLADAEASGRLAYRHTGRFDAACLDQLDRPRARDQFNYTLNSNGTVRSNSTEALGGKEFIALLDEVEAQLRRLGERIFSGAAGVDPYCKGAATACDYCDYRAVCRIDDWTHKFRELRAVEGEGPES